MAGSEIAVGIDVFKLQVTKITMAAVSTVKALLETAKKNYEELLATAEM